MGFPPTASSSSRPWTAADIPDQTGRTVVVTGANSGLGEVTARELAAHGATVVLACRNVVKAEQAAAKMTGEPAVRQLDLADLASVRSFATATGDIDVLVNNAGVMAVPKRRTSDGFEMQIGTNFLGPFALTGLLLPKITDRVVTLTSFAHHMGHISLADLNWRQRHYERWSAYAQSKLADLMFAYELNRRLRASGSPVRSIAAHPGYAATELQSHTESIQDQMMALSNRLFAQSAADGALPTLFAATAPDAVGGALYGPDGLGGLRGKPRRVGSSRASQDAAVAAKLWAVASELTGVDFGI
ncbi:MAG TPA: oxidoreductase [Jatrophihabitans sp.]|nr:oxidoreductase [Jatrophihabitans sp.]